MNVVEWMVQDRVIFVRGVGDQTIESIEAVTAQLKDLMSSGEPPVHVVIDNRYVGHVPKSIKLLSNFMTKHENSGYVVAIGGNELIKFFSKMLAKMSGSNMLTFKDSIEDALLWLQKLDESLPQEIDYIEF